MNKIIVFVIGLIVFCTTFTVAKPTSHKTDKLKHTRTVQAQKDTEITYAGINIFVPAGQTVSLGRNKTKDVVISADEMNGIKVGPATLTSKEPAVIAVQPKQNSFTILEGNNVQLVDANGHMAKLSQGASVSGEDIRGTLEEPTLPPAERVAPMHPRRIAEMKAEQERLAAEQAKQKSEQKK